MLVDIKQKEVEVELKLDEDTSRLKLLQAGDEVKDCQSERTQWRLSSLSVLTALKHTIYNTITIISSSIILDILI